MIVSKRLKGWEKRYVYLVDEELNAPFDEKTSNCGDLVAAAIIACWGPQHPILDLLEDHRKQPDEKSRIEWLAARGGMHRILESFFQVIPWMWAQQADIGVAKLNDNGTTIYTGVVILDGQGVGKSASGVVRIPMQDLYRVYKV